MGWIPYACADQPLLEGEEGRAGPRGHADLRIEALDVVVGGLWRDIELAGGFLGRISACDQAQHFDLARGQAGEPRARHPARGLAGAGEHGLDGVGAELSVLDRRAQLCRRGRVGRRRPVGSRFARGLEGFGRGKDAGGGRKIGAARIAVIAAPVEPLVMALHQRRNRLAVTAQGRERALAVIGMKMRRVGLAFGQRGRRASRSRPAPPVRRCRAYRPRAGHRGCRMREVPCAWPRHRRATPLRANDRT